MLTLRVCCWGVMVVMGGASALCAQDQPIALFNGKDLSGWTFQTSDGQAKADDTWKIKSRTLICLGRPAGLLRSTRDYDNYVLKLEWRWTESIAGDSGVFVHTTDEKGTFGHPKSIEVNLFREHAGELMAWGPELEVVKAPQRKQNHIVKMLPEETAENEMGQWNRLEVTCQGKDISVKVNGALVNHVTNCSVTKGAICLESNGTPVLFRNVTLTPLKK